MDNIWITNSWINRFFITMVLFYGLLVKSVFAFFLFIALTTQVFGFDKCICDFDKCIWFDKCILGFDKCI